jgi:hypothetical protein
LPGRNSNAAYQVHFVAKDLPPLGFAAYHVTVGGKRTRKTLSHHHKVKRVTLEKRDGTEGRQDIVFENDVSLLFSSMTVTETQKEAVLFQIMLLEFRQEHSYVSC